MTLILLSIPTGETSFIDGESHVHGHEGDLLVESVSFDISIEQQRNYEGKRTIHVPEVSPLSIVRKVDTASAELTRWLLGAKVSKYPWTLTFLRSLGGGSPADPDIIATMQVPFLTLTLDRVMVTGQEMSFDGETPTETLTVSAAAVTWAYAQFDSANQPTGNFGFTFDLQSGMVK